MHRRVQMQPSERTRVGIGEQCTTDLVGQFWTQLSFTLSPCNGGKHLGDRQAPRSSDPVGRAKTHRVSRSRLPARRASPTRWHRRTPRPRCPGETCPVASASLGSAIENGGRERLGQLWHPASKCRTATKRLSVCGTGRHQSRDGLASIRNCDFVPLSNLSNQCRQVLPGFTYSCFFHPAIVLHVALACNCPMSNDQVSPEPGLAVLPSCRNLSLYGVRESARERNFRRGVIAARHEQFHHRVPPVAPCRGVVAELVGLRGKHRSPRVRRLHLDQRDDGRVVLCQLVEALLHIGVLRDTVSTYLGEIRRENPGIFLRRGVSL